MMAVHGGNNNIIAYNKCSKQILKSSFMQNFFVALFSSFNFPTFFLFSAVIDTSESGCLAGCTLLKPYRETGQFATFGESGTLYIQAVLCDTNCAKDG